MNNPSGIVLGYDPGGNGNHGLAVLDMREGEIASIETATLQTVSQIVERAEKIGDIVALGIDAMTCLAIGDSGWRPADRWLRNKYPAVVNSVISPNSIYGSMALNGIALMVLLKQKSPNLVITEAHPKVLFYHLFQREVDYANILGSGLLKQFPSGYNPKGEHEIDASLSALAAVMGITGQWTHNLHSEGQDQLVRPCGETFFYWPC